MVARVSNHWYKLFTGCSGVAPGNTNIAFDLLLLISQFFLPCCNGGFKCATLGNTIAACTLVAGYTTKNSLGSSSLYWSGVGIGAKLVPFCSSCLLIV